VSYCTYIYSDPKTSVPVYVGMGASTRPRSHLNKSHNVRLHRLIQKRKGEGFDVTPKIIPAPSAQEAREMEMLLIVMIGRVDLKTGTLFNKTEGGDGTWCHTLEARALISEKQRAKYADPAVRLAASKIRRAYIAAHGYTGGRTPQARTVDGITIYPSRKTLISALGQGKSGLRHPNFKWITP